MMRILYAGPPVRFDGPSTSARSRARPRMPPWAQWQPPEEIPEPAGPPEIPETEPEKPTPEPNEPPGSPEELPPAPPESRGGC